jgi:hypothetical protein
MDWKHVLKEIVPAGKLFRKFLGFKDGFAMSFFSPPSKTNQPSQTNINQFSGEIEVVATCLVAPSPRSPRSPRPISDPPRWASWVPGNSGNGRWTLRCRAQVVSEVSIPCSKMQSGQGSQRWMMVMAPFEGATADFLNIGIAGGKWLFYKYKDIIKVDIMSEKSLLGLSWARAFTTEKIQVPNATAIRQ